MSIFNMVGGGGGSGGGYKSYTQLKAMPLSDAITELNTNPQGYYDNLNGNGHIIGIGIANDDKTTYQCWDVSPIIYWNGSWRNGEIIIFKIKTNSSGYLKIPRAGYNASTSQDAPYDWRVSYDNGTETQYSGTGAANNIIIADGLTANTEYTVVIRPNSESYGWARAFGFYDSFIETYLTEIVYDGSYKGYGTSDIDTGNYFRNSQYRGCTSLIIATQEVLPSTVTTIGNSFRNYQYNGCILLTTPGIEVLPSSVITVGKYFRGYQYQNCTSITAVQKEIFPNSVTTIGTYFRSNQYNGCTSLLNNSYEAFSSSVTAITDYFRYMQYKGCSSLINKSQEILPNTVTTIGAYFRAYQFQNCTGLIEAGDEALSNSLLTISTYFRSNQYNGCTSLKRASQEKFSNSVTSIGQYFRYMQYKGCSSLKVASEEDFSNQVTRIANYYRSNQYQDCTSLTIAPTEYLLNTVTYIGTYFRSNQYNGCTNLTDIQGWEDLSLGSTSYRTYQFASCTSNKIIKVLGDVGYAGQSSTLDNSYVSVVLVPSAYLQNYIDATTYPRSGITDSKFVGY